VITSETDVKRMQSRCEMSVDQMRNGYEKTKGPAKRIKDYELVM